MEKYIYKITNEINDKCYIGQTTDPKRRFSEHQNFGYGYEGNKMLYLAFKKYGLENFTFEIIEDKTENYNEREKYWISHFDANGEGGYNMTSGGDEPPLHIKENSPFFSHSIEEVKMVFDLLQNTKLMYEEIANKTNYTVSSIKRINAGILWHDESIDYPIRKENTYEFKEARGLLIIEDLLNTSMTQKEIGKKHGCARTTVTAINSGKNFKQEHLTYPLRK